MPSRMGPNSGTWDIEQYAEKCLCVCVYVYAHKWVWKRELILLNSLLVISVESTTAINFADNRLTLKAMGIIHAALLLDLWPCKP